ncbi:MAG: hypothetical protein IPN38_15365 [Flavobacteriales bacterium]|nr:hypothetical protein [Flavobacteriales bacterium]
MITTIRSVGTHARLKAAWLLPSRAALVMTACTLLLGLPTMAQPPSESLTEDFPGLTAKERTRIAKKEGEEAKADAEYQAVMNEAERLFQAQHFEEALAAFRKARTLRPYNVYPKVKIKDLEAMLGRSPVATVAAAEPIVEAQPLASRTALAPEPQVVKPTVEEAPVVQRVPEKRSATVDKVVPEPKPAHVAPPERTVPTRQVESGSAPVQDGVTELRYKEANAFVIERRVVEERHPVVYKRVQHAYGQVYYFKDSTGIGERVWKERFSEP